MPSHPLKTILLICFVAIISLKLELNVSAGESQFPDSVPLEYQRFFAHFVDRRSMPERILNRTGVTLKDYGRSFALIAGVSRYPNIAGSAGDLSAAREDIRKLTAYLSTYENFDEIVVLQDDDMTQDNISFFLEKYFPKRLQQFPKSRFLFAYSGHGMSDEKRSYLLTSKARSLNDDTNGIAMGTLRAMFQNVVDYGYHVLALINACYSGDFLKRPYGGGRCPTSQVRTL